MLQLVILSVSPAEAGPALWERALPATILHTRRAQGALPRMEGWNLVGAGHALWERALPATILHTRRAQGAGLHEL